VDTAISSSVWFLENGLSSVIVVAGFVERAKKTVSKNFYMKNIIASKLDLLVEDRSNTAGSGVVSFVEVIYHDGERQTNSSGGETLAKSVREHNFPPRSGNSKANLAFLPILETPYREDLCCSNE
jgi:hypothetical protein